MSKKQFSSLQLISVRWWNASAYFGLSLAEALHQSGHPVLVGGRAGSPPLRLADAWQLPRYDRLHLESVNPLRMAANVYQLRQLLRRHSINLINAHRPEDGFFAAFLKQFSPRPLPVVRTVSDVRPPKANRANHYLHSSGADHLIFSCKASFDRYEAVWPIFKDRSSIIYSAIDAERFKPRTTRTSLRGQLGFSEEHLVIGIIARLSPVKDHHTFLRAATAVVLKWPQARFLIAGEAAQFTHEDLREFAVSMGIADRVAFLPRDDRYDIRDIIDVLDIGTVCSNGSEVICRIAVEYMAMGKPLVTTDTNVLPEIVDDGENGLVAPARDHEALAACLNRLAGDSDLRKRMGETARNFALTHFSYPVFVKQTLMAYEMAAEAAARAAIR